MSLSMPSFTLALLGEDKSTIRRHFPGLALFGITPNGAYVTLNARSL